MAATHRQTVDIVERALALPSGHVATMTDKLRQAGLLPNGIRHPIEATPAENAIILMAAILGHTRPAPDIVPQYLDCRESGRGPRLGDRLAAVLAGTAEPVISLQVDLSAPAATLVLASYGYGIPERFVSVDEWSRPAFERLATVPGELIRKIAREIQTAPEVRKGRRKTVDTWKA